MAIGLIHSLLFGLFAIKDVCAENIHSTEVFKVTIGPWLFNWTDPKLLGLYEPDEFSYRPTLMNSPDLPSWMYYTHSDKYNRGFLYGSPPLNQQDFQIEIIVLNKKTYEVQRRIINMNMIKKKEVAKSEIQLKLDKLNVDDMLNSDHYKLLLDVFRKVLWPESEKDLYVTFLASARYLRARLPLNPTEGEGIVIHIGSTAPFSRTLLDLQEEVEPLQKKGLTNCPDFKHTSVERFFKEHNFSMDWCAFLLVNKSEPDEEKLLYTPPRNVSPVWRPISKLELPLRGYVTEMIPTFAAYLVSVVSAILLLNIAFCYWDDERRSGDLTPLQYEAMQRASNTLRSLSTQRDCDVSTPRGSSEQSGIRPEPPPYITVGPLHLVADNAQDGEEARTWYC